MSQALANTPRRQMPPRLAAEIAEARENGQVGTRLLSEDERCRVWTIVLAPGERIGFHTHVLDYFWTAVTSGQARSHYGDGRVADTDYAAGDIEHMRFGPGESMTHDLANIGTTELLFTTVEFKGGANDPLALPPSVTDGAKTAG